MRKIYLTKMNLNPRHREVRKFLDYRNCQNLHKFVMSGFPNVDGENREVRQKFGVLHRLEVEPRRGTVSLLVQSAFKPIWNLESDFLLEDLSQKDVGEIYSILPNGIELMFRLRANPTKCVSGKNTDFAKFAGKRVELRKEEEQNAWLERKGAQHGFRLTSVQINADVANVSATHNGKIYGSHEKGRLTFNSVIFNGNLQVTDTEKFKETLLHGIGQGKAYGFGLLSIAKSLSF